MLGLLLLLGPQSTTRQCEYAAGATKLRVGWVDLAVRRARPANRNQVERMATIVADLDQGALSVCLDHGADSLGGPVAGLNQ